MINSDLILLTLNILFNAILIIFKASKFIYLKFYVKASMYEYNTVLNNNQNQLINCQCKNNNLCYGV